MPVSVDLNECRKCGRCVDECPWEARAITELGAIVLPDMCHDCEYCLSLCDASQPDPKVRADRQAAVVLSVGRE